MSDRRQEALRIIAEMLSPAVATALEGAGESGAFAAHIGELALDNVFGAVWTRPGLDRRARSLVTLGILIALRASEELAIHFPAAVRNGVTVEELAEVIYQASAYAGFPAAASARGVALAALKSAGMLGDTP